VLPDCAIEADVAQRQDIGFAQDEDAEHSDCPRTDAGDSQKLFITEWAPPRGVRKVPCTSNNFAAAARSSGRQPEAS
jgi:hypothetical protein